MAVNLPPSRIELTDLAMRSRVRRQHYSLSPKGLEYTRNGYVLCFQIGIHTMRSFFLFLPIDIGSDQDTVTIVHDAFCFGLGCRPAGASRPSLAPVI